MENIVKQKIKIFSHESDIDGIGSIILGKLAYGDIEFELFRDPQHLKDVFHKYILEGRLYQYDQIYITDLSLYPPVVDMVNDDIELKGKVLVFDHHQGAIDAQCNKYDFTNVIITDINGKKKCGTELFYEYLYQKNDLKRTSLLDSFVELTRLEDTWDWIKQGDFGVKAHDLAILFNCIGKEAYIVKMIEKISQSENTDFQFDDEEKKLIRRKKEECEKAISEALIQMEYFTDELGNKFGIVFTKYEFRNDIPEYVRNIGNPQNVKYIIIVAMDKGENGQKSYRRVEDNFDVNEIAKIHGGGGHVAAAAVAITQEQKEKTLSLPRKEALEYIAKAIYRLKIRDGS